MSVKEKGPGIYMRGAFPNVRIVAVVYCDRRR